MKVPNNPWHGDKLYELTFPSSWNVQLCRTPCDGVKGLKKAQIRRAINNPLGTKTLSKLVERKKEAVIIFDDSTRPTKTYQYANVVLEELVKASRS